MTQLWIFTIRLWDLHVAAHQIPDDIFVRADLLQLKQTLGMPFRGSVFECKLKSNKHLLSPTNIIPVERGLVWWIWVNNNSNYVISEHNGQWNHEPIDSGGIRKHFREDRAWPRFQFSFPKKTMIILLSFTPSKLFSDLKAPHQSSGYEFHFKIYGDTFEDLHIKCSMELLLWLH